MKLRTTPDPNLVEAMAEIKAILKKRDIAGTIILCSPDALEYLTELEPSWSCARFETNPPPGQLGLRIKTVDLPDQATKKKALEDTIGMFLGFKEVMTDILECYAAIMSMVRPKVGEIEHKSERIK